MTDLQWENILSRAGAVFNFGIEKKEQLKNSRIARLIASVPYLAGCRKTAEAALVHLSVYIMSIDESTRDIFFHKPEDDDDIYSRLLPISDYSGGDSNIIRCCTDLIALCMVSNYKNDTEKDDSIGKYNPISAGKWDYDNISKSLILNIDKTITPDVAAIYSKEEAVKGLWKD